MISSKVMVNGMKGSLGFGFVKFGTPKQAECAINGMNNKKVLIFIDIVRCFILLWGRLGIKFYLSNTPIYHERM